MKNSIDKEIKNRAYFIGDLIENRYRVISEIGSGNMGVLYHVADEAKNGKKVAFKTVKMKYKDAGRSDDTEYFKKEFQILTQVSHPNLVSVYEYGIMSDGRIYFTMEFINGKGLDPKDYLSGDSDIFSIVVQVCRALSYLHTRGIVHGDLKPSNILIKDNSVKIVDFGLAIESGSSERRLGYYSPGFTAPEVKNSSASDSRADLFSLGALWYSMIIGEAPIFMYGAEFLIQATLQEVLHKRKDGSEKIIDIITRLLADTPEDRYANANEVIAAINHVAGTSYELDTKETVGSYALRGEFIGREKEIKHIHKLWEKTETAEGKLLIVSGETGTGKTRLMEELIIHAQLSGARIARGQCVKTGGSAYHPMREVLRLLFRYVENISDRSFEFKQTGPILAAILPELWDSDLMAGAKPPIELEPDAARQRLNNTIFEILQAAAKLRPTLVVIEDIHWADEATLVLINFLSRLVKHLKLMICVTYTDSETPTDILHSIRKESRVEYIKLNKLSHKNTIALVRSMLGLKRIPEMLSKRIKEITGGNVFFIQELVRSMAEDGQVLARTVDGWRVSRELLEKASLPESIQEVVWSRLKHLSEKSKRVLIFATMVGSVFWDDLLEEIGGIAKESIHIALGEAIEKELIYERNTSIFKGMREFRFSRPVVREVLYKSVSGENLRKTHVIIARWLMIRNDKETGEFFGLIADHLEKSGQTKRAITYLYRAGKKATNEFANKEAIEYFSRALNLTPEADWDTRYDLLLSREKIFDIIGNRKSQHKDILQLKEITKKIRSNSKNPLGVMKKKSQVAIRLAHYLEAVNDYSSAVKSCLEAIAFAREAADEDLIASAYIQMGSTLLQMGEYTKALEALKEALIIAESKGLKKRETLILLQIGIFHWKLGSNEDARCSHEKTLEKSHENDDKRGESSVLNNLGLVAMDEGDFSKAFFYYNRSLRICSETGDQSGETRVLNNLGAITIELGDYDNAFSYFDKSLRIIRRINRRRGECIALSNLGILFYYKDDYEKSETCVLEALVIAKEIKHLRQQGFALNYLGHALSAQERFSEAEENYKQALSIRLKLREFHFTMDVFAGLARIEMAQGDFTQAGVFIDKIINYSKTGELLNAEEPARIYHTCYNFLSSINDPRADEILKTAYDLIIERADKISDKKMRTAYLKNVRTHREIIHNFEQKS